LGLSAPSTSKLAEPPPSEMQLKRLLDTSLFDALRADTHPFRAAVLHNPDTLQVGEPFFLCPVVRVAHTISYLFPLPAYVTNSCHKNPDPCYIVLPPSVESRVYSLVSSVSIEISTRQFRQCLTFAARFRAGFAPGVSAACEREYITAGKGLCDNVHK
jgi:hypothetical protein